MWTRISACCTRSSARACDSEEFRLQLLQPVGTNSLSGHTHNASANSLETLEEYPRDRDLSGGTLAEMARGRGAQVDL